MTSGFERSGVELILDKQQYSRNIAGAIADANKMDTSLDGIVDSANRAERALNSIDGSVNVDVTVDDGEIRQAQSRVDDLTQTEDIDVNADTSSAEAALDVIKGDLETLKKLAVIDLVIQGAGMLARPEDIPFVSSIIEADDAMQRLEGTTGRVIPGAADLVNDLFTQAWGDSRQAIADTITEAAKLGISMDDLDEAVTTAFQVSDTGIGETSEVLRTMDTMVKNNLAKNFREAGDIIVTAFQNGGDRGQDLLDTLNEYGSTFDQLKISGPGAIALITSGLKAGVDNSDRIADAMRETGIRLREIGTDENIASAFTRLDELSSVDLSASLDAYNAGEISGDEFFAGFFDSLRQASEQDPAEASTIAATLVGTISEDFGPEAIAQLSPAWDETMGVLEGRAETASNTINDTLSTSFTTLARTIENEVATTLDDAFDIQGVIDKVKAAVPQIATAIREGASISEAIEVGFDLEGDPLQRLESMFNNIAIGFLQAIQSVLEVLGKGDQADSLASEIARISTGQFDFDLRLANDGEALRDSIQSAIDRGVDPAKVTERLQNAAEDMLARGDLTGAQTLIDQIKEQATVPITYRGVEYAPGTTPEEIQARNPSLFDQEQVNAEIAKLFSVQSVDTTSLEENARILGEMYTEKYNEAVAAGDYETALPLAEQLELDPAVIEGIQFMVDKQAELAEAAGETATANEDTNVRTTAAVGETQRAIEDYTTNTADQYSQNVEDTIAWANEVVPQFDKVGQKADAIADKIASINDSLATLGETPAPTSNAPTPMMADGGSLGHGQTAIVGDGGGPELFTAPVAGSIINAANTNVLMGAISQLLGMGGGGSTTNNYITLNSSANVQNNAQADVFGSRLSRQVRGFT